MNLAVVKGTLIACMVLYKGIESLFSTLKIIGFEKLGDTHLSEIVGNTEGDGEGGGGKSCFNPHISCFNLIIVILIIIIIIYIARYP